MVTAERLRELVEYNPDTGVFMWAKSRVGCRKGGHAGTTRTTGYRAIFIDGRPYLAHRLAWLWMTGDWPDHQVDHVNRDRADNRWRNLRVATHGENMVNRVQSRVRKYTLPRGVYPCGAKFRALVTKDRRRQSLGTFATSEQASAAYQAAAARIHGAFFSEVA